MNQQPSTPSMPRFAPPPQLYFVASALFHYLGPAFAVLLFARVEPLGVAWLRIASAALIFAAWRRPWRRFRQMNAAARWNVAALGVVLPMHRVTAGMVKSFGTLVSAAAQELSRALDGRGAEV